MSVVGTPSTLSGMSATGVRKVVYDGLLREDIVRPSLFADPNLLIKYDISDMKDLVMDKKAVFMDVSSIGKREMGQSIVVTMRIPPTKKFRYGNAETILGNEDEASLRYATFYYNEIKKGLKSWGWGYNYNDTEYLNYNKGNVRLLKQMSAENDDDRIQQALLLTYPEELIAAPVSLSQQFNKNWAIPNLATGDYPTYDHTPVPTKTDGAVDADEYYPDRYYSGATSFVENVAAAMMSGSGTGATSLATLNIDSLATICSFLPDQNVVEPFELDGRVTRIWKVPTPVKMWMANPQNTGSLGEYTENVADYKDPKRHKIVGEMGRIFEEYLMVHDTRCPTLTVGGSAGSYTLTPGFLHHSNNDDRNRSAWSNTSGSTNYGFHVTSILGANALAIFRRDELRTNLHEDTEYGQIQGVAAYKGEGIQIPRFDLDTVTATSMRYRGSCIVPVSFANVGAIAT